LQTPGHIRNRNFLFKCARWTKYRQEQIAKRLPEDFDELPEEEQQELIAELEDIVVSFNPDDLREEIAELSSLIRQAKGLEATEQEVKVRRLKALLTECGVFEDPNMKLLIFTEHKDTLDFLVGDGRNGRPMGKLQDIEAAIDLGTSDPHPLAKIGKDVASTAALVSAIVFVVIVILILVPRLIDRLAG
jgi:hypothetical protein